MIPKKSILIGHHIGKSTFKSTFRSLACNISFGCNETCSQILPKHCSSQNSLYIVQSSFHIGNIQLLTKKFNKAFIKNKIFQFLLYATKQPCAIHIRERREEKVIGFNLSKKKRVMEFNVLRSIVNEFDQYRNGIRENV